jgi:hypothetical protein
MGISDFRLWKAKEGEDGKDWKAEVEMQKVERKP